MNELCAIVRREFYRIWSDSRLRSVILVAPFIYATLFCAVYSQHTLFDIPIAIMQEDFSAPSRILIRMIDANSKLKITKHVRSIEEGKDLMLSGQVEGFIVIPRDFSEKLKKGKDSFVIGFSNATSMVSANMVSTAMNIVVQSFSAGVEIKTLMKKGERLEGAKQRFMPVKLDLRPLFNPGFNYSNFIVPGLLMAILQQVILLGMALSFTAEKEFGTLTELLSMSKSDWKIVVGKALPYLLMNCLVAEIFLRVLFPLNDIPMEGSWILAIPFTFLFVMTIVSWGLWMSAIFKTRLFATQMLMFIAMPSFILSGFTWPHHGMPMVLRGLAHLLPLTYFVNSFRKIYLADVPFRPISGDFLVLGAFCVGNILLSLIAVKRLRKDFSPPEA